MSIAKTDCPFSQTQLPVNPASVAPIQTDLTDEEESKPAACNVLIMVAQVLYDVTDMSCPPAAAQCADASE